MNWYMQDVRVEKKTTIVLFSFLLRRMFVYQSFATVDVSVRHVGARICPDFLHITHKIHIIFLEIQR